MMIAHASIPADDPKFAAGVLAEILGGEAIRFPPGGPGAFMAWSGDGKIELEVVRRGRRISYDEVEGVWEMNNPEGRASESQSAPAGRPAIASAAAAFSALSRPGSMARS